MMLQQLAGLLGCRSMLCGWLVGGWLLVVAALCGRLERTESAFQTPGVTSWGSARASGASHRHVPSDQGSLQPNYELI